MLIPKILPILAVVAGIFPAAAQEEEGRPLSIRCLAFELREMPPAELYAHDLGAPADVDGVPVSLKKFLNHEIDSLILKGDRLVFTDSPDRESVNGDGKVFARWRVPDDLRRAVVMFVPAGEQDEGKCRVLSINDDIDEFPRGSFRVLNLSPNPVQLMIGDQQYNFRPAAVKVIEDAPMESNNVAVVEARFFRDSEWQPFTASRWPNPGRARVIQVFYEEPVRNRMRVSGIRDVAVPELAEQQ